MRPLALLAACSLAALAPGEAGAETLHGYVRDPERFMCSMFYTNAHQWTWKDGGQVAYVTRLLFEGGPDFVVLGADDDGVWTYEQDEAPSGASAWDAHLAHTRWDGARRRHFLDASHDGDMRPIESRRAAVEARLWAWVAEGERARTMVGRLGRLYRALTFRENPPAFDPRALSQALTVELPRHDAEGDVRAFPGWIVKVSSDAGTLRFSHALSSLLCHCGYEWIRTR